MNTPTTLKERTLSATTITESGAVLPQYIRMPAPGRSCSITGLRRGLLYELARDGKIKTAVLKRKSAQRGVRLILVSSLLAYCNQCLETPENVETDELVED